MMDRISFNPSKYRQTTKLAAFEFQDRAAKVIKDLGIPKEKSSQVFKWFKTQRNKAESSYRYIQERKDIKTPFKYFCWLMTH